MGVRTVTVDFETESIEARPNYPPKPVGVAIRDGRTSRYLAWAHPAGGNNVDRGTVAKILHGLWKDPGVMLLFHNAKFDLDVAQTHFGLPLPQWDRVHDTKFSLFLRDPHAPDLKLKPSAERILHLKPAERDRVRDWLVDHKIIPKSKKDWGGFISKAPAGIVGEYAIGDVDRTWLLHQEVWKKLDSKMKVAYDRERRLLPILLKNEHTGMRVNVAALDRDIKVYQKARDKAAAWLRKRLRAPKLDLDSKDALADVLDKRKVFTAWTFTPKSKKRSTAKGAMPIEKFNDPEVALALSYWNRLGTVLSQSMRPWFEQAQHGGFITTDWNQVRAGGGGDETGARTGRLSCSRFQNISKNWTDKNDGYKHPRFLRVPELPLVRKYILPDKGEVFIHRDYNQQELRLLAHFEDGPLLKAYTDDPRLDIHTHVKGILDELGFDIERRFVKTLNFGKLYGMGVNGLMHSLRCDESMARRFISAHAQALPGVKELETYIKAQAKLGRPIRTWGGRLYYCEAPRYVPKYKREMTFEYKLLNYLIQGSAADVTKESICRAHEHPKWAGLARFLVTVHDEINASAPKKAVKEALRLLAEVMESVETDVPMLSDAKVGSSWGSLESV